MALDLDECLPSGWTVRSAVAADADQIASLETVARAPLGEARGGLAWLRDHEAVGDWTHCIARADVLVAVIDDVVVGYLELQTGHDTVARIRQVFVEPEARGVGFGDLLLAAALERARERGATTIEAEALPGDRDTKNLYERAGITARTIVVAARLDGQA